MSVCLNSACILSPMSMAPIKVLLVFSYKLKFVRIKTDAIAVFQQDLFVGDKRLPVEECLIAALQITEIKLPIVEADLCVVRRHRVKGDRDIILLMAAYFGHGLELIGGFLGVRAQVIQHDLWHRHTRFGTPRATDRHDADNPRVRRDRVQSPATGATRWGSTPRGIRVLARALGQVPHSVQGTRERALGPLTALSPAQLAARPVVYQPRSSPPSARGSDRRSRGCRRQPGPGSIRRPWFGRPTGSTGSRPPR